MTDSDLVNRRTSVNDEGQDQKQTTSEMFKDMLSQKRNMIMSKLTSFDSDVSFRTLSTQSPIFPKTELFDSRILCK